LFKSFSARYELADARPSTLEPDIEAAGCNNVGEIDGYFENIVPRTRTPAGHQRSESEIVKRLQRACEFHGAATVNRFRA